MLLTAAILLSLERITYVLVWRRPQAFRLLCERAGLGPPVVALQRLFYLFKVIQGSVFLAWCYHFAGNSYLAADSRMVPIAVGSVMMAIGQSLNFGVFYRLGTAGVFYGNRFGYEIAWCNQFPFSMLEHPQYFGALLSIWGFFIAMRFPAGDWYLIPVLETVYYAAGAWLEK